MPIYAYRCAACGHAKDVLQKMSDAPLVVCPQCGAEAMVKQVTAAGFQLKGSGWYVTDFRGDSRAGAKGKGAEDKGGDGEGAATPAPDAAGNAPAAKPTDPAAAAPAPAPAPAPTSAPSSGGGASGPAARH